MVELRNKQLLIDGRPQLIMCGEIHYFRLRRDEWQDRIAKLKAAGCNAVASYVPWLCHEPVAGQVDLDGHTPPELDLAGFIDLCRDNDLLFLVRPGPFIMVEMTRASRICSIWTASPKRSISRSMDSRCSTVAR